jgi:hypothetical protein
MWLRLLVVCALLPAIGLQGCGTYPERRSAPQAVVGSAGDGESKSVKCRDRAGESGRQEAEPPSKESCRNGDSTPRDDRHALPVLIAVAVLLLIVLPAVIAKDVAKSLVP